MKKCFKTMALCMVLGATVGCQKETINTTVVSENVATYSVQYSVDETSNSAVLYGDRAMDEFLHNMLALAKEGYRVRIRQTTAAIGMSKEIVTFTTTNEAEAHAWSKQMIKQGYEVDITYDAKTGIYTCTAIK